MSNDYEKKAFPIYRVLFSVLGLGLLFALMTATLRSTYTRPAEGDKFIMIGTADIAEAKNALLEFKSGFVDTFAVDGFEIEVDDSGSTLVFVNSYDEAVKARFTFNIRFQVEDKRVVFYIGADPNYLAEVRPLFGGDIDSSLENLRERYDKQVFWWKEQLTGFPEMFTEER